MKKPIIKKFAKISWDSIDLPAESKSKLKEILNTVQKSTIKGLTVLFEGESSSGKTFAAELLGKGTGREIYKIDLASTVSKYIGETEKNLNKVFSEAENKNWILFFDEADALFGKRTEISDAHDRFANAETKFLLQKIEQFDGTIIISVKNSEVIDKKFLKTLKNRVKFSVIPPGKKKKTGK